MFFHTVAAYALERQCGNYYLGAIAITDADLGASAQLPNIVPLEEKRKAAIDRYITKDILNDAWECLRESINDTFSNPIGDQATFSNGLIYYFPGNNFNYGKIFTSIPAQDYFKGSYFFKERSVIKKISFSFTQYGEAILFETAIVNLKIDELEWYKIDKSAYVNRSDQECLSCHKNVRHQNFLFGISEIMYVQQ